MKTLFLFAIVVGLLAYWKLAFPAAATREEMARSALISHLFIKDRSVQAKRISHARDVIIENAHRNAEKLYSATVLFEEGIGVDELVEMSREFDFEVIRMEVKFPLGDTGMVQTVSVGARYLLRVNGSSEYRLNTAIAFLRGDVVDQANLATGNQSEHLRKAAFGPMYLYKVELIASANRLRALLRHPKILAAFPDDPEEKINSYRWLKNLYARGHRLRQAQEPKKRR